MYDLNAENTQTTVLEAALSTSFTCIYTRNTSSTPFSDVIKHETGSSGWRKYDAYASTRAYKSFSRDENFLPSHQHHQDD